MRKSSRIIMDTVHKLEDEYGSVLNAPYEALEPIRSLGVGIVQDNKETRKMFNDISYNFDKLDELDIEDENDIVKKVSDCLKNDPYITPSCIGHKLGLNGNTIIKIIVKNKLRKTIYIDNKYKELHALSLPKLKRTVEADGKVFKITDVNKEIRIRKVLVTNRKVG